MGKDSLLLGKKFPHFVGTNSHNMRECFPTICGTIGTNRYSVSNKPLFYLNSRALFPDKNKVSRKKKEGRMAFDYEKYPETL